MGVQQQLFVQEHQWKDDERSGIDLVMNGLQMKAYVRLKLSDMSSAWLYLGQSCYLE